MPNKFQIATIFLGLVVAQDMVQLYRKHKQYQRLYQNYIKLYTHHVDMIQELSTQSEQVQYLATLLNERETELDEFDLIVLADIIGKD